MIEVISTNVSHVVVMDHYYGGSAVTTNTYHIGCPCIPRIKFLAMVILIIGNVAIMWYRKLDDCMMWLMT